MTLKLKSSCKVQKRRLDQSGRRESAPVRPPSRKFMREASKEMLQSKPEHAGKADPMVGAVLVDRAGKIIGRAHRGKYGTGDHGEFTLLEKAGVRAPSDAVLYVTLEPCTKRGPRKTPCADRIIASGIKHVVIGIKDPNPE